MTTFSIYIDRKDLVLKTAQALSDHGIHWTGWLMCETSDGRMRVTSKQEALDLITDWHRGGGAELHSVTWPRDGRSPMRYSHLAAAGMMIRADVEGQDRDGKVERAAEFDGGVTSFPFHKVVKDWQHPEGEEVQVYPTRTNESLNDKMEDSIDWALRLTGADMVALPLYGLTGSDGAIKYGSQRAFLRAMVIRCLDLGVKEISFWSAKHLWKNNYALAFLTEDLPQILADRAACTVGRPGVRAAVVESMEEISRELDDLRDNVVETRKRLQMTFETLDDSLLRWENCLGELRDDLDGLST